MNSLTAQESTSAPGTQQTSARHARRMSRWATLTTLTSLESRLMVREWAPMLFAFVFPPMMMLVLAGVFAGEGGTEYGGADATDYYIAAYLAVPLAALSLIGLPTALASYQERGVVRRFAASGIALGSVVGAQVLVTAGLVVLGAGLVLGVAAPIYGLPELHGADRVVAAFALGTATMLSVGVVLGLLARTARSAQALGLLVFMPMWLLGGGGPPQGVMTDAMRQVADLLPMTHITVALRDSWLGVGDTDTAFLLTGIWLVGALAVAGFLVHRRSDRT